MAQYNFAQSSDPTSGRTKSSSFIIGRVKSVVLGKEKYDGQVDDDYSSPRDLGKIRYEILYSNMNISKTEFVTQPAYPMFSFFKQYPLESEIVMIVPGPSSDMNDGIGRQTFYYFPPYALWNSVNNNAFPNLEEYAKFLSTYYNSQDYKNELTQETEYPSFPLGSTFSEKQDVRCLRPFEGDTIIESRFGQSIRFGSTVLGSKQLNTWSNSGEPGSPITIIRNGQGIQKNNDYFETTVENINEDHSSIWLTSGQEVVLDDINQFPLKSFGNNKVKREKISGVYKVSTSKDNYSPSQTDSLNL